MAFGAAAVLSGCQMVSLKGHSAAAPEAVVATTVPGDSAAGVPAGGERDVEAPKVFSMTAKALWDGRPSLGGVWVAHTSVKDPQRVIIRNPANGKSVVGALFRREIDNPGPPLQLSSETADALGILAGQPVTLSVVALERVEAPAPAPVAPPAPAKPAAQPEPAKAGIKVDKLTATASAAIDKATAKGADKAATKSGATTGTDTKTTGAKPATAAAPAAAPAATAPATDGQILRRPYVQLGIFSVEANAKKAATQMQKAGMKASVHQDQSQGKTYWRVLIGPAASVADRDAMAAKVKSLGYPDSYAVTK